MSVIVYKRICNILSFTVGRLYLKQFNGGPLHWITDIESKGEAPPFFFWRHNCHLPAVSSRYRYSNPAALALMRVTNRGVPTLPDSSFCRRSIMAPPPTNTTLQ